MPSKHLNCITLYTDTEHSLDRGTEYFAACPMRPPSGGDIQWARTLDKVISEIFKQPIGNGSDDDFRVTRLPAPQRDVRAVTKKGERGLPRALISYDDRYLDHDLDRNEWDRIAAVFGGDTVRPAPWKMELI
jgi:hypothetical protein